MGFNKTKFSFTNYKHSLQLFIHPVGETDETIHPAPRNILSTKSSF